jgi:hypothetical protein
MLHRKKSSATALGILFILTQNVCETSAAEWNKDCYSNNACYKLLEDGRKFTWFEAYDLCHKEKGYLLNETWIAVSSVSVTFRSVACVHDYEHGGCVMNAG